MSRTSTETASALVVDRKLSVQNDQSSPQEHSIKDSYQIRIQDAEVSLRMAELIGEASDLFESTKGKVADRSVRLRSLDLESATDIEAEIATVSKSVSAARSSAQQLDQAIRARRTLISPNLLSDPVPLIEEVRSLFSVCATGRSESVRLTELRNSLRVVKEQGFAQRSTDLGLPNATLEAIDSRAASIKTELSLAARGFGWLVNRKNIETFRIEISNLEKLAKDIEEFEFKLFLAESNIRADADGADFVKLQNELLQIFASNLQINIQALARDSTNLPRSIAINAAQTKELIRTVAPNLGEGETQIRSQLEREINGLCGFLGTVENGVARVDLARRARTILNHSRFVSSHNESLKDALGVLEQSPSISFRPELLQALRASSFYNSSSSALPRWQDVESIYELALARQAISTPMRDKVTMPAAYQLLACREPRHTSYVLLNAFRVSNYHGEYELLGTDGAGSTAPLVEYAKKFSSAEVQAINDSGIPGLGSAISILRSFPQAIISTEYWNRPLEPNSEITPAQQLLGHVERVATHLLNNGTPIEQRFAIEVFCASHFVVQEKTHRAICDWFATKAPSDLRLYVLEKFDAISVAPGRSSQGTEWAIAALTHRDARWAANYNNKIADFACPILCAPISESLVTPLAQQLDISVEKLQTVRQFLSQIGLLEYLKTGSRSTAEIDIRAVIQNAARLGDEAIEALRVSTYPPIFKGVLVCCLGQHDKRDQIVKNITQIMPSSASWMKDKFELERAITCLTEDPQLHAAHLARISGSELPGQAAANTLFQNIELTHVMRSDRGPLMDMLANIPPSTVKDIHTHAEDFAVCRLAKYYPENLVRSLTTQKLAQFMEAYLNLEESLVRHQSAELIPAMRVIGVVELLQKEEALRDNDSKLLEELRDHPERYFPNLSERAGINAYISKRLQRYTEKSWRELMQSDEDLRKVMGAWKSNAFAVTSSAGQETAEDRLNNMKRLLGNLFDGQNGHLSPFVRERVRNQGTTEILTSLGRRSSIALKILRKEQNQARAAGTQVPEDIERQVARIMERIKARQAPIKQWGTLGTLCRRSNAEADPTTRLLKLREKLREYTPEIESLGVATTDIYGKRVFNEDFITLGQILKEEKNPKIATISKARLGELQKCANELQKEISNVGPYLNKVREELSDVLPLLQAQATLANTLEMQIAGGRSLEDIINDKSLRELVPLAQYLASRLSPTDPHFTSNLRVALEKLSESTGITLIEREVRAGANPEVGGVRSTALTFNAEAIFSRVTKAVYGQCLDPRPNKNSVGNSVYLVSFQEPQRQMVVGYDAHEIPRVNALLSLAPFGSRTQLPSAGAFSLDDATDDIPSKQSLGVVMDVVYTSDGSALTKEKFAGVLDFALARADATGLPLLLSKFCQEQSGGFDLEKYLSSTGRTFSNEQKLISVQTGVTGQTYLELTGFTPYHGDARELIEAVVIQPQVATDKAAKIILHVG